MLYAWAVVNVWFGWSDNVLVCPLLNVHAYVGEVPVIPPELFVKCTILDARLPSAPPLEGSYFVKL